MNELDSKGYNSIHYVCSVGDLELARILWEMDLYVDSMCPFLSFFMGFHLAATNGHLSICEYLLDTKQVLALTVSFYTSLTHKVKSRTTATF